MSAACPTFGFVIRLAAGVSATTRAELIGMLRARGFVVTRPTLDQLVVRREGDQATDADRQIAVDWTRERAAAAGVTVGDIVDLSEGD